MRTLWIVRHSLTEANQRHVYCGETDLPLSEAGRALAMQARGWLPEFDRCVTSGMRRADETLLLMTGRAPDAALNGLREMRFGAFEMQGYEALKALPAYRDWIEGRACCPGGETNEQFHARVLAAGEVLREMDVETGLAVCHGGVIVQLMQAWFPNENRLFYDWQPGPCGGYRVEFRGGQPHGFREVHP